MSHLTAFRKAIILVVIALLAIAAFVFIRLNESVVTGLHAESMSQLSSELGSLVQPLADKQTEEVKSFVSRFVSRASQAAAPLRTTSPEDKGTSARVDEALKGFLPEFCDVYLFSPEGRTLYAYAQPEMVQFTQEIYSLASKASSGVATLVAKPIHLVYASATDQGFTTVVTAPPGRFADMTDGSTTAEAAKKVADFLTASSRSNDPDGGMLYVVNGELLGLCFEPSEQLAEFLKAPTGVEYRESDGPFFEYNFKKSGLLIWPKVIGIRYRRTLDKVAFPLVLLALFLVVATAVLATGSKRKHAESTPPVPEQSGTDEGASNG